MIPSILRYSSSSNVLTVKERIHADDEFNTNIKTLKSKEYSPTIAGKVKFLLPDAEGSKFFSEELDEEDPDCQSRKILEAEQLQLHWPEYRNDFLKHYIHELDPAYESILWNDNIPEVHFLVFFCQSNLIDLFKKYLYDYHNNLINLSKQWQTNLNLPQNVSAHRS